MKTIIPYNAGELRVVQNGEWEKPRPVLICGHVWWPVEKRNAYHCLHVNPQGEPIDDKPDYIWDNSDGQWAVFQV